MYDGTATSGIHGIPATKTIGSLALFQRAMLRLNLSHLFHFVNFARISTHCRLTVSFGFLFEPTGLIVVQMLDVCFFRGIMTPSLMLTGPDD